MVVDTSVLLSAIFNEKTSAWAADELQKNIHSLRMSTVNYCEVLILAKSKQPQNFNEINDYLSRMPIRMVAPTILHAQIAANARILYPLNLGDCFAYALAKDENCPILTLDSDFYETDINVISING